MSTHEIITPEGKIVVSITRDCNQPLVLCVDVDHFPNTKKGPVMSWYGGAWHPTALWQNDAGCAATVRYPTMDDFEKGRIRE